jgi:tRNA-dihydrouridine synthase A
MKRQRIDDGGSNEEACSYQAKGSHSNDILSIAPMIQWTDRNWRYYMRLITKKTWLYSEMIMDNALYYNPKRLDPFLGHDPSEQPLAIQLGGNDPSKLGEAVSLCESYACFSEINLNSGCPSNKAKKAGFGAELMLEPALVRQITHEMKRRATMTDVTVKCRIGVTGRESWENLQEFIIACKSSGINKMIIHARSCILKGLSPAQNRTIPPLHYEVVHRLVKTFPDMRFVLNGGITDFTTAKRHLGMIPEVKIYDNHNQYYQNPVSINDDALLPYVDGVMIGREAYNNPFLFQTADEEFFGEQVDKYLSRGEVLEAYLDYVEKAQQEGFFGSKTCLIVKPLHNIFHGCASNHLYKQKLDSLLIKHSQIIDKGEMEFRTMIMQAIEDTIPSEFLELRGPIKSRSSVGLHL